MMTYRQRGADVLDEGTDHVGRGHCDPTRFVEARTRDCRGCIERVPCGIEGKGRHVTLPEFIFDRVDRSSEEGKKTEHRSFLHVGQRDARELECGSSSYRCGRLPHERRPVNLMKSCVNAYLPNPALFKRHR